jgi:hypothetical protein
LAGGQGPACQLVTQLVEQLHEAQQQQPQQQQYNVSTGCIDNIPADNSVCQQQQHCDVGAALQKVGN